MLQLFNLFSKIHTSDERAGDVARDFLNVFFGCVDKAWLTKNFFQKLLRVIVYIYFLELFMRKANG